MEKINIDDLYGTIHTTTIAYSINPNIKIKEFSQYKLLQCIMAFNKNRTIIHYVVILNDSILAISNSIDLAIIEYNNN